MDSQRWDERYSQPEFVYGVAPNEFLVSVADQIPPGPVLMLGEGEGRNAVFLASRGHDVVALDQSAAGLAKARRLAEERGVRLETLQADLRDYALEPGAWAAIVSIFCHLPPAIRAPLYAGIAQGLRPGGVFILEAYRPEQLKLGTGGPSDPAMLLSLATLRAELPALDFLHAEELEREVREGAYHTGMASVVQVVARRAANG